MNDHVYKTIELTGTSAISQEDAIAQAIARASQTLRHLRWFQVVDSRGRIEAGRVSQWQVTLKVGVTIEDDLPRQEISAEPNVGARAAIRRTRKGP